jgi:L,D-transpeptidase ErfK/SrfK
LFSISDLALLFPDSHNSDFLSLYELSHIQPVSKFTVENKQVDPTYYGPDSVIEHDDQANPLGERWIDIGNSYGIHGTIDSGSIGRNESRGCIRMHNDDVAAVYDLLTIGSEVTIRE